MRNLLNTAILIFINFGEPLAACLVLFTNSTMGMRFFDLVHALGFGILSANLGAAGLFA